MQAGGCFEWVVPPPSGISHPRSIDHYAQALVRTEHKGDLTLLQGIISSHSLITDKCLFLKLDLYVHNCALKLK